MIDTQKGGRTAAFFVARIPQNKNPRRCAPGVVVPKRNCMSKRLFYDNLHCSQLAFRVRDVHEVYTATHFRSIQLYIALSIVHTSNQTTSNVHYTNRVEIRSA